MTTPRVTITTTDGAVPVLPPGSKMLAIVGPSSSGTADVPAAFTRPADIIAALGDGPLVELGCRVVKAGVPVLLVKAAASTPGSAGAAVQAADGTVSAVTHGGTGSSVGTIHTGSKPNGAFSVIVKFPIGGTRGTGGMVYQISLDGGETWGFATALGTDVAIVIPGIGAAPATVQLDLAAGTIATDDYYAFTTTAPVLSSAGSLVITKTGSSTPSINVASAPLDDYQGKILIVAGGTIGQAGITYRTSLDDGRTYGPVTALGTATKIEFGGVRVDFAGGTLDAGDSVAFWTTAPACSAADMAAAFTALKATAQPWEALAVATPLDTTIAGALDVLMADLEAAGKDRAWIGSWRMPNYDETHAQYVTAFGAAWGAYASPYGYGTICAHAAEVVSAVSLRSYRRPVLFAVAPKWISVSEEVNIAQIDAPGGPLAGVQITDANGNPKYHDEYTTPGLDDLRALTLRTFPGQSGVFCNRPLLFSSAASDFKISPHRRVFNLFLRAVREYFNHRLNQGLKVAARTGFILPSEADEMERGAYRAAEQLIGGKASSWAVVLDRNVDLRPSGTHLSGDIGMTSLASPEGVDLNAKLSTPASNVQPV